MGTMGIVRAGWDYQISSSNKWDVWDGLEQSYEVKRQSAVIAFYSITVEGKNAYIFSKLYANTFEKASSRAVCGATVYCQLSGFWVKEVPPGKHYFEVKYRTKSDANQYASHLDWMNRALTVVTIPGARVYSVLPLKKFMPVLNSWTLMAGLHKRVSVQQDRYVIVTYNIATKFEMYTGHMRAALFINQKKGDPKMPAIETISWCGWTMYCHLWCMDGSAECRHSFFPSRLLCRE